MSVEAIEATIDACATIKWPRELRHGRRTEDGEHEPLNTRQKIEVIEDFLLLCAEARNNCENGRIVIAKSLRLLREEWDEITGWEVQIKGSASKATGPQIDAAKRRVRPDLWPSIQKAEFLLRRLNEQVGRFKANEEAGSRLYTIWTGS